MILSGYTFQSQLLVSIEIFPIVLVQLSVWSEQTQERVDVLSGLEQFFAQFQLLLSTILSPSSHSTGESTLCVNLLRYSFSPSLALITA